MVLRLLLLTVRTFGIRAGAPPVARPRLFAYQAWAMVAASVSLLNPHHGLHEGASIPDGWLKRRRRWRDAGAEGGVVKKTGFH